MELAIPLLAMPQWRRYNGDQASRPSIKNKERKDDSPAVRSVPIIHVGSRYDNNLVQCDL
jgi:hypothetical protein